LDALKKAGIPVFAYGNFITVAVNFFILAFVIFIMVKQINRLKAQRGGGTGSSRGGHTGRYFVAARNPRSTQTLTKLHTQALCC
jgi:hypothetical protein